MNWTQIRTTCRQNDLDTVSAVMSVLDSHLMIEDASDIRENVAGYGELIDEELLKEKDPAVSVYLSEEKNAVEAAQSLREHFSALGIEASVELIGVNEEDWANNWKQYYHPVEIGSRIVIVPEWLMQEYQPKEGALTVSMDPGMAFGSGTHETTRLCATMLEEVVPQLTAGGKEISVLDVGTGSGILAICSAKLGAKKIDAYDIDPTAVRIAKENAEINDVEVNCGVSDLLSAVRGQYDVVSANITADIILRMTDRLADYVKPLGVVVLSGIINTQEERVKEALAKGGLTLIEVRRDNDWVGLMARKTER